MRVAQIAPLIESVPPRLYGGTERVVSYLTEELVALGHEVALFASGDSITAASLVPCCTQALRLDTAVSDPVPYYMLMLDKVRSHAAEFDVMHFHIDHFRPKKKYPRLALAYANLYYACGLCNTFKGDAWPSASIWSRLHLTTLRI